MDVGIFIHARGIAQQTTYHQSADSSRPQCLPIAMALDTATCDPLADERFWANLDRDISRAVPEAMPDVPLALPPVLPSDNAIELPALQFPELDHSGPPMAWQFRRPRTHGNRTARTHFSDSSLVQASPSSRRVIGKFPDSLLIPTRSSVARLPESVQEAILEKFARDVPRRSIILAFPEYKLTRNHLREYIDHRRAWQGIQKTDGSYRRDMVFLRSPMELAQVSPQARNAITRLQAEGVDSARAIAQSPKLGSQLITRPIVELILDSQDPRRAALARAPQRLKTKILKLAERMDTQELLRDPEIAGFNLHPIQLRNYINRHTSKSGTDARMRRAQLRLEWKAVAPALRSKIFDLARSTSSLSNIRTAISHRLDEDAIRNVISHEKERERLRVCHANRGKRSSIATSSA